jgi:hypothetical protein
MPIARLTKQLIPETKFASLQEGSISWDAEPPVFLVHSFQADCNPVDLI